METFWYIIKVLPGKERQLVEQFNQQISLEKIKNIIRFICPTEKEIITLKDKKILRDKVIYSGYLYFEAKCELEKSELNEISTIPNIMGLMGNKTPILMRKEDANKIIKDDILEEHIESKKLKYQIGDKIMITSGPFTGFFGLISDIKMDIVDVEVKIFGRNTKVSLNLSQIKK